MKRRWRSLSNLPVGTVSPALFGWLAERHSLTRRLRIHCHGAIQVQVLSQGWARPSPDEASALQLRSGSIALVREVILLGNGKARIYARSIIPLITLHGTWRRLRFLGTRPLGDLLFADPEVVRRAIEITAVHAHDPLFAKVAQSRDQGVATLWGRRSIFHLQGKPLLVSEFFLPGLCPQ